MSGRKRLPAPSRAEHLSPPTTPAGGKGKGLPPIPKPSPPGPAAKWLLVLASLALVAWIAFLAILAWRAS